MSQMLTEAAETADEPPASTAPPATSLARNTIAQAAPKLLGYLLSFASAPVIVDGLGLRRFGIWALTGALAQYAALIDFGAGISLARYIAAHQDDRRLCGEYLTIGWLATAAVGLVLAALAIPAAVPLAHTLQGISVGDMRTVLISSVVLILCTMVTSTIIAFPIGNRRMVTPNVGLAIGSVVNFIASVGSIALGAGLPGYALANAGAGVLSVLIVAGLVFRAEGLPPAARPARGHAREFLLFSAKNQTVRLMDLVNYQTDKIVIAFAVGPTAAGAYELANRVAMAVRQVGVYATGAIDIELTTLMRRSGLQSVRDRYSRLTQFSGVAGFPGVLFVIASAPLLLGAWLAHVPANSEAVLVALSAAYLIAVSTGVGYGVAVAAGEPGLVARTSVGTAAVNLVLTAGLAPALGIWGVLTGTVVALTGGALAQVVYVHRRYQIPLSAYTGAVLPTLRAYALLAVPVAVVSYSGVFSGRGPSAVALVLLGAGYTAGCLVWAARTGRLPEAVRQRLPQVTWLHPAPAPRGQGAGSS